MAKPSLSLFIFVLVLGGAVLGIYLPGWNHALVFDDLRLNDDAIFGQYGNVLDFKQRMLSYGSFVWLDALTGSRWGLQRLLNIVLHLGTVAALYALVRELLLHTRFPEDFEAQAHFGLSRTAAARVAVALFAVNPVAVYAVAYLVQRSIVMATLFAALACWMFVRGVVSQRLHWYAGALLAYAAAVLSKEHALMVAALAVPLYIHVRRPGWKAIATLSGAVLVLLVLAAAVFFSIYGHLVGTLFDQRSIDFAAQLEQLRPGTTARMYPLSILNEAALFFAYGFLWFVPNVAWMSIDLRPAFPLSYAAFPQVLGALGYVALLGGALWAVLRRQGVISLVGVALLFPLVLFVTEFATVWVQDPFVLYRSYLWAMAFPVVLAVALTGLQPRTIYLLGLVVGIVFSLLAFERVLSLQDETTAWGDAAEKIDRQAPANAVGRWRPFLNLGAQQLDQGLLAQAQAHLATAESLGALQGSARFNLGVALQEQQKHTEALAAFAEAEQRGFTDLQLYYQRGESQFALGQFDQAFASFTQSLQRPAEGLNKKDLERLRQAVGLRRAEAAIGAQQYAAAVDSFRALLQAQPQSSRLRIGLGMALTGQGNTTEALALFDTLLARQPSGPAYYGRAMAHYTAGQHAASLADLDQAIALEPRNPRYPQVRAQVMAAAAKAAATAAAPSTTGTRK